MPHISIFLNTRISYKNRYKLNLNIFLVNQGYKDLDFQTLKLKSKKNIHI